MSVSILVADDEPDVADLFRQQFRRESRQGTYVVHFAASAEQVLDVSCIYSVLPRSNASTTLENSTSKP